MIAKTDDQWNSLKAQTKDKIVCYINNLNPGQEIRLPSEQELCSMMGVSRITLRSVLDELTCEGKIFRKHGSGTYVNPAFHQLKASLYPAQLFQNVIRDSGYTPKSRYVGMETIPAGEDIAAALELSATDEIVVSRILLYADDHMCIWCSDHFDKRLVQDDELVRLWTQDSVIFQLLFDNTGRSIAWDILKISVTDTIRAPEINKYIEQPTGTSKPFLVMKTINYDTQNRPLLYSVSYIDTDYVDYGLIRKKRVDVQNLYVESQKS